MRTYAKGAMLCNAIVVMGETGSGKSSFIKAVSGNDSVAVGHCLESCTHDVIGYPLALDSSTVTLVDTPGFNDTHITDQGVFRLVVEWMVRAHKESTTVRGIIYMHNISRNRVAGTSMRTLSMLRELCGSDFLESVALVTTMWDNVGKDDGERREEALRSDFWKPMILCGSKLQRYNKDARQTGLSIVRDILAARKVVIKVQQEVCEEGKSISNTSSARLLDSPEERNEKERIRNEDNKARKISKSAMELATRVQGLMADRAELEHSIREVEMMTKLEGFQILQSSSCTRRRGGCYAFAKHKLAEVNREIAYLEKAVASNESLLGGANSNSRGRCARLWQAEANSGALNSNGRCASLWLS